MCFLGETRNCLGTSGLESVWKVFIPRVGYSFIIYQIRKLKFTSPPSPNKTLKLEGRLQFDDTTAGCKRNCFEMSCLTACSPFNHFYLIIAFFKISYESIISKRVLSPSQYQWHVLGLGQYSSACREACHIWVISQPTNSRLGSLSF